MSAALNQKIHYFSFQNSYSQSYILSSCSPWVILLLSGLWSVQINPLKAMDKEAHTEPSSSCQKKKDGSVKINQDKNHSSVQDLWDNLSVRLKKIISEIDERSIELLESKKSCLNITDQDLEKYKKLLAPDESNPIQMQHLYNFSPYKGVLFSSDTQKDNNNGRSGNKVVIWIRDGEKILVLKRFKPENIKTGIQELWHSLIALRNNPSPQELAIARIFDAFFCSENYLNIVMEPAKGEDLSKVLETASSENATIALAKYLALFHSKNSQKLNNTIDKEKYITHAAEPYHTLVEDTLNDRDRDKDSEKKLLRLIKHNFTLFTEHGSIKSDNILQILTDEQQDEFVHITENICNKFIDNSCEIYRSLMGNEEKHPYFLTLTHRDAHKDNFFYDGSKKPFAKDSHKRITMIDFDGIVKTYGYIGDPAEDVGRFLGSIWDWAVQENLATEENLFENQKVNHLRRLFLDTYLATIYSETIKNNGPLKDEQFNDFVKKFIESSKFYELRFYRALFNEQKGDDFEKDKNIKLTIIKSWIEENKSLHFPKQEVPNKSIEIEKSEKRSWKAIKEGSKITSWLPEWCNMEEEFIEAIDPDTKMSYLSSLKAILEDRGTVTLSSAFSSTVTMSGQGGLGKTSNALAYAQEARKNRAYDLIYWIYAGTDHSLFNSYKSLLQTLTGKPVRDMEWKQILQHLKSQLESREKCLLIYDNVPPAYGKISAPEFLKNWLPNTKNTHILITSRLNDGWQGSVLKLNLFSKEDAVRYLQKITGLADEYRKVAAELAEELQYFPLALAHAAHYIKLVGGDNVGEDHFSTFNKLPTVGLFEKYRNAFKENHSKITYEHLIARTFRMTEAYITNLGKKPLADMAKKLMNYCAYLDSDSLTEEIFPYETKSEKIKEALQLLSSLSLIKNRQNQSIFSMHRLLQEVIRSELKEKKQDQEVFSDVVHTFNALFEKKIYKNKYIDKYTNFSPHIIKLLNHSKNIILTSKELEHLKWNAVVLDALRSLKVEPLLENMIFLNNNVNEKIILDYKKEEYIKGPIIDLKRLCLFNVQPEYIPRWLTQFATQSNATVKTAIAEIYNEGSFVIRNRTEGFKWSCEAAAEGDANACYRLGVDYIDIENNYKEGLEYLNRAADQKHPGAQLFLGFMYENGEGVPQSYQEAAKYYEMLADQGGVVAQFRLGFMYLYGIGVPQNNKEGLKYFKMAADQGCVLPQFLLGGHLELVQNYKEAFKYYKMAADQNHVAANCALGVLYMNERGVKKDLKKAKKYFKKAANDGGFAKAQHYLGLMYLEEQNYEKAFKYYKMAKEQGFPKTCNDLGLRCFVPLKKTAHQENVEVQTAIDSPHLTDDETLLEGYNRIADDLNISEHNPIACYELGEKYLVGKGITQDYKAASKYFKIAADQGHADACCYLGVMHVKGYGVRKDHEMAFKYFKKAADQNHAGAQYHLGVLYMNSWSVGKSPEIAFNYYERAAEQNHVGAQNNLGCMYLNGWGVLQNYETASKYFKMAANQNFAAAQSNLGCMYFNGWGVLQNYETASKYFKKAADQGHADANYALGTMYVKEKNYETASKYFKIAADQNHFAAQRALLSMELKGCSVKKTCKEKVKYDFEKSAFASAAVSDFETSILPRLAKIGCKTTVQIREGFDVVQEGIKANLKKIMPHLQFYSDKGVGTSPIDEFMKKEIPANNNGKQKNDGNEENNILEETLLEFEQNDILEEAFHEFEQNDILEEALRELELGMEHKNGDIISQINS